MTKSKDYEIDHLPFVITKSGEYKLTQDLIYNDVGSAIRIYCDDVKIDGEYYKISLKKAGSGDASTWKPNVAIKVSGSTSGPNGKFKNIEFTDMTITTLVTTPNPGNVPGFPLGQSFSTAILLNGAENVRIRNVTFDKITHGVETQNVDGLIIEKSRFIDNYGVRPGGSIGLIAGCSIFLNEDSKDILVDRSTFSGQATGNGSLTSFGILTNFTTQNVRNITFDKCDFNNMDSCIHPLQCANFTINECNMRCENIYYNMIQLGYFNENNVVENFLCTNTNIWGRTSEALGGEAIEFIQGDGALLQNVNFDYNGTDENSGFGVVNVGVSGEVIYNNVVFDNITMQGPSAIGITVTNNSNFTLKNSHISDADIAVWIGAPVFGPGQNADFVTIVNNEITGKNVDPLIAGSIGVLLDMTNGSIVKDNDIRSFCTAIQINSGADGSIIKDNIITNNATDIVDNGTNTLITNNTSWYNTRTCAT